MLHCHLISKRRNSRQPSEIDSLDQGSTLLRIKRHHFTQAGPSLLVSQARPERTNQLPAFEVHMGNDSNYFFPKPSYLFLAPYKKLIQSSNQKAKAGGWAGGRGNHPTTPYLKLEINCSFSDVMSESDRGECILRKQTSSGNLEKSFPNQFILTGFLVTRAILFPVTVS